MGCLLLPCQCLWLSMQLRVFIWAVSFLLLAEGEAESQWLQDTGLSDLLSGLGLDGHHQGLLSTLTQTQVAAVCRRLDIYTRSARRRHKAPIRDVRDIFGGFSSGVSQWLTGDCRPCLPGPMVVPPHLKWNSSSAARLCWRVLACRCAPVSHIGLSAVYASVFARVPSVGPEGLGSPSVGLLSVQLECSSLSFINPADTSKLTGYEHLMLPWNTLKRHNTELIREALKADRPGPSAQSPTWQLRDPGQELWASVAPSVKTGS